MSRYIIIGGGAVGGALAATFHENGIDYILVARGESYRIIREQGLTYTRPSGTKVFPLAIAAGPDELVLESHDVLLLATKAQDTEAALAAWAWQPVAFGNRQGTASELPLVILQNGLDGDRAAIRRFANVFAATVMVAGRHVEPGKILTGSAPLVGEIFLGSYPPHTANNPSQIADDLSKAQWAVQLVDDITRWKSWKILQSVRNGTELLKGEKDQVNALAELIVEEAATVLKAEGYTPADPTRERLHDEALTELVAGSGYEDGQQSTWQSLVRGVPLETDYLNGEIVLRGRLLGIATPYNAALQQILGSISSQGEKVGTRSVDEVRRLAATLTLSIAST